MVEPRQPQKRADCRILVVDDNPAVLKLLKTLFEEEGMNVHLAESVQQARDHLIREEGAYDLVLSDISMPIETGFDLLQWIKQPGSPYAELPVLLTTAQLPEAKNRLKGLALGAVDYVVRPIELKELVLRSINAIGHFQRIKGLETTLQDSENLAMAGRLMAASTHEIKNLVGLVKMCADHLTRSLPDLAAKDPRSAANLKALGEASALLTDVARNAATLMDPQGQPQKAINLTTAVASVGALMRPRVRPCNVELPSLPPDAGHHIWALGHEVRLKQVIINLLLNAADAIQEVEPVEGGRITVAIVTQGDRTRITVKDNGIGLPRAGEKTEFTAFSTTKRLRGGQGLGLWLCARLIAGMGGALSLASEGVGTGATATVSLPTAAAPAPGDEIDLSQYFID